MEYRKDASSIGNTFDAPFTVQIRVCESVIERDNTAQIPKRAIGSGGVAQE